MANMPSQGIYKNKHLEVNVRLQGAFCFGGVKLTDDFFKRHVQKPSATLSVHAFKNHLTELSFGGQPYDGMS